MSRHASLSEFFEAYPNSGQRAAPLARSSRLGINEHELENWAGESVTAESADDKSHMGRIGAVIFWTIVAGLLAARFFLIDPATLRPAAEMQKAPASHQTAPKP